MFVRSEEVEALALEVLESVPELEEIKDVPIAFMESDKQKRKGGNVVYGECIKVNELYKDFAPFEFIIVVYSRNAEGFTDEQMKILLEHELLHVGVEYNDNGDISRAYVKEHDFSDFKQITRKYGVDWAAPCSGPEEEA